MQKLSGVYKCLTRESRDQLLLSLSVWFLALFDSVLIKITSEEKKPLVTFFFFFFKRGRHYLCFYCYIPRALKYKSNNVPLHNVSQQGLS